MEKQLHPNLVKLPAFNNVSSADNSLSLRALSCAFFIGFVEDLYTLCVYHVLFKHTQHTKWYFVVNNMPFTSVFHFPTCSLFPKQTRTTPLKSLE